MSRGKGFLLAYEIFLLFWKLECLLTNGEILDQLKEGRLKYMGHVLHRHKMAPNDKSDAISEQIIRGKGRLKDTWTILIVKDVISLDLPVYLAMNRKE